MCYNLGLLKEKISQALLKMQQTRLWGSRLKKYGLFVPNNKDNYQEEREIQNAVKNMSLGTQYY
jgi:ABC-type phosphate/phosphonate transport system substrate-binding protein